MSASWEGVCPTVGDGGDDVLKRLGCRLSNINEDDFLVEHLWVGGGVNGKLVVDAKAEGLWEVNGVELVKECGGVAVYGDSECDMGGGLSDCCVMAFVRGRVMGGLGRR